MVVVIGECVWDQYFQDMNEMVYEGPGGRALNLAINLHYHGIPVLLMSNDIGADDVGQKLQQRILHLNFPWVFNVNTAIHTPICSISTQSDKLSFTPNYRNLVFSFSQNLDQIIADKKSDYVVWGGYNQDVALWMKKSEYALLYENVFVIAHDYYPQKTTFVQSNLMVISHPEYMLMDEGTIRGLQEKYVTEYGKSLLIVTHGKHGTYLISKTSVEHFNAFEVGEVNLLNTIGCGDVFLASLITQLYHGVDIQGAIQYGQRMAFSKLEFKGSYFV